MPDWLDNLSQRTDQEIVALQQANRAWQKELKLQAAALINNKLAKRIKQEEYIAYRETAKNEANECKRRGSILADELWHRRSEGKRSSVFAV